MLKDIVVNLSSGRPRDVASDYAISIAEAFDAHVAGIAFAYEVAIPATIMGGVPVEFIESQQEEAAKLAQSAIDSFDKAARAAGISAETRTMDATLAGAAQAFGEIARRFDLSVVPQYEPDSPTPTDLVIEGALFESGRPVIVVPYIQKTGLKLDKVGICWDGSRAAARAIGDALPFLKRAKQVEVVIVTSERGKTYELKGLMISQHLARHGLKVEINQMTAPDIDAQSAILSYVSDSGTDFLVMGGYGHSRLREFVLGGVTRSMLGSMTVPVLMSH